MTTDHWILIIRSHGTIIVRVQSLSVGKYYTKEAIIQHWYVIFSFHLIRSSMWLTSSSRWVTLQDPVCLPWKGQQTLVTRGNRGNILQTLRGNQKNSFTCRFLCLGIGTCISPSAMTFSQCSVPHNRVGWDIPNNITKLIGKNSSHVHEVPGNPSNFSFLF